MGTPKSSAAAANAAAQTDLTDAAAQAAAEKAAADAAAQAAADAAAELQPPVAEVTPVRAVVLFGFRAGVYPGVIVEGSPATIKVLVSNGDADDAPGAVEAAAQAQARVIEV